MVKIAAVIPVHNKAPHLVRALDSVLAQTAPVDEIVLVDDASVDGSREILEAFARGSSIPVRLLTRDTPGPGGYAARNLAIESARADWCAFLDADDSWRPGFVAALRAYAHREEISVVFASRRILKAGGETLQTAGGEDHVAPMELDFDGFLALWLELGRCPIWTSATAIRRSTLIEAGLFPAGRCKRGGDKDMWLRAMSRARAVALPMIAATWHADVAEQVTRSTSVNQRHCLRASLDALIARSEGRRRRTLKAIHNLEVRHYARWLLGKEKLAPELLEGFHVEENPLTYAALKALAVTPLPVQRAARSLAARL